VVERSQHTKVAHVSDACLAWRSRAQSYDEASVCESVKTPFDDGLCLDG
jgi:hypothetical protein